MPWSPWVYFVIISLYCLSLSSFQCSNTSLFLIDLAEKTCEPEMHHRLQEHYFFKFCLSKNKVDFCLTGQSSDHLPSLIKSTACSLKNIPKNMESEAARSSIIPLTRMNTGFCKVIEAKRLCACIIIESQIGLSLEGP